MRQMIDFRDYLIEKFSDIDKALSFLEVALEEYEKDPDGAALYYGFSAAVEAQGGVQKFAMKTHSAPQAVSDALLSKDEIQIAELLKKQVLAKRGEDKDIAQNEPLPKGWREIQLGEFMEFKNGLNTKKENYGSGVKFVNVMDVFSHNYLYENDVIGSVQVTKKQLVDYSVKYGDVLFNRTSETFEEIAMSSVYLDKKEIIFGGFVIRGRQKGNILIPEYSAYCFQAHTVRRELIRRGQGAVRANIGQKDLSKIPMVIPPVNEQKAIASLLEKWDTAIEKTEALIEAKEKWFKWLLKTLISDQQDNPEWREVKLGELCSDIAYGYTATASNEPIGPKFLRITDIVSDSINWESVPYCEIEDSKKHRYTLETGDIVIARTGATTGYNQVVRSNEHSVFASYLIRYKLRQDIAYPFFIGCVLKSTYWKRFVERIKARSAQPGANAKDFASFKIFLPTFPEQERIANILDTAKKEIEFLKQLAEQYRTQKRGLMQKLLTGKWRVRNQ